MFGEPLLEQQLKMEKGKSKEQGKEMAIGK
jgi:hypothetical protein